jgi:hypothetical protein
MDSLLDAIAAAVARAAESWPGVVVLTSPIWLLAAVRIRQALMRRRAYRDFAEARHLKFAGVIPSDARAPYTRIPLVRSAVLLFHVVEGEWDGLPIRLFEMPWGRRGGSDWTTIIVAVEGRLHPGPETERVIAARPEVAIRTNLDVLCLSPGRRLVASEFADWLSYTVALAKAMEHDAKEAARFQTPPELPPMKREMFGMFTDD